MWVGRDLRIWYREVLVDVHALAWIALSIVVLALIAVDIFGHVRTPHAPTLREAGWWSFAYVMLGLAFGLIIWYFWGGVYAGQYWAGFMTEKALSLDNLFVFIIIMASFRIPRTYQQKALLWGIIIALILRLIFILVGAAIIEKFSWVFYIFGAWLLWTAWSQAREGTDEDHTDDEYHENGIVRWVRHHFNVTEGFDGQNFFHRENGKLFITPMFLVVFALGSADLMFAFDSIPAIFGLTSEPYLVFAANAFALLGLRQLYFLVDGLLERLVYLHYGLAAILGFIGIKLILHAMHENHLPFINGGEGLHWAPEIGILPSLAFISGTIIITIVASLMKTSRDRRSAVQ